MELFKRKTKDTMSAPKPTYNIKQKKAKNIPPFITIDVGSHDVKIMYAAYSGKTLTVKKCACIELPDKVVVDGKIVDEKALVNAVMHVINTNKISVSGAVVTLACSEIIQREITVPVVPDNNLKNVVMYEIAKFLPVDVDTYAIQYEVLDTVYDEKGIKAIADIPSREVLLSKLLGSFKSPIASFARVVKAVAEKQPEMSSNEA